MFSIKVRVILGLIVEIFTTKTLKIGQILKILDIEVNKTDKLVLGHIMVPFAATAISICIISTKKPLKDVCYFLT